MRRIHFSCWYLIHKNGASSSAIKLETLCIGLMAGPVVSLQGSPTVSPVIAAMWAGGNAWSKSFSAVSIRVLG